MLLLPKRQCKADTGSVLLLLLGLSTHAPPVAALSVSSPERLARADNGFLTGVALSPFPLLPFCAPL